jgi:ABC-2 type transport system ATP-binding protein
MNRPPNWYKEAEAVPAEAPPAPLQPSDSVISAQHLTKKFHGEAVVHDVSFEIPYGKIFGFIGPSGSGKTTTIRLLTGYYVPTEGKVLVFGRDPVKFHRRERSMVGYMPQLFVLYPNLTVWENMNFAASLYGMSPFREKRLRGALDFVELNDHRHELARNISGGMQRRLSLAATLVHNPTLIFLDEPTAGIDPLLRRKFWDRFIELRNQGSTIFITTQYVTEADNCDIVGVQDEGRLLIVDTPKAIRHNAFGGDMVDFVTEEPFNYQTEMKIRDLDFISPKTYRTGPNSMRLIMDESSTSTPKILEWAQGQNLKVNTLEEYSPSFEDVFVELVRKERNHE